MKFSRQLEAFIKKVIYFFFRIIFRNKPAQIPVNPSEVSRILILRYDAIGDMIVTTPLFRFIKSINQNILIDVIASLKNEPIIRNNQNINQIFTFDGKLLSLYKLIRNARKNHYDIALALVLNKTTKGGLIANLICGKDTLKASVAEPKRAYLYSKLFNYLYDNTYPYPSLAELQLRLIAKIFDKNYQPDDIYYDIFLNESDLLDAENFCKSINYKKYIIFNISASQSHNRFSDGKNINFLKKAVALYPELLFIITADRREYQKANAIESEINKSNLIFKKAETIMQLAALAMKSYAIITPDTSLVHIATAFNKPLLAFFSNKTTTIEKWMPKNKFFKYIVADDKLPIEAIDIAQAIQNFQELLVEVRESEL